MFGRNVLLFQLFLILSFLQTNVFWPSQLISSANSTHIGNTYIMVVEGYLSVASFQVAIAIIPLIFINSSRVRLGSPTLLSSLCEEGWEDLVKVPSLVVDLICIVMRFLMIYNML